MISVVLGAFGITLNDLDKRLGGGIRDQRNNRDNTDHSIVKISLTTEKSPGDLRRLAITKTHVKDHHR